jgi:glycosyltransferase involved in cell wall biosynthesis
MAKPRICYINPTKIIKRPVSEISGAMASSGFKTTILMPKKLFSQNKKMHHSKLLEKSKLLTYSTVSLPGSSEQSLPVTPVFFVDEFKALKNNDIIHMWVPFYLTNLKIIFTKKIFFPKKKLILTMDTIPGYSFSMGGFWNNIFRIYNKLFGWVIFKTPDVVTLYGKSLVPFAVKAGVPKEKIKVQSTGVHIPKKITDAEIAQDSNAVRKEFGLAKKTRIVLSISLLMPRKGIDKIIKIADKLRNEDIIFLIVSDGPKRKEYEAETKKLGLEKKILFLGFRTDVHKLYHSADLLLLPSDGEGLPGVVMEAMSLGVPCVASNIPCIPDLIENGKSGFLCSKDDIDEFTKKIMMLLKDNKLRDKMSKNAVEKIKSFEWKKVLPEYEKMYNSLQKENSDNKGRGNNK